MQNQTLKHHKSYREGQAKIRIEILEKWIKSATRETNNWNKWNIYTKHLDFTVAISILSGRVRSPTMAAVCEGPRRRRRWSNRGRAGGKRACEEGGRWLSRGMGNTEQGGPSSDAGKLVSRRDGRRWQWGCAACGR
jgi:hypothetical protein